LRFNNIALTVLAALSVVGCGCGGNQQSTELNTPGQPGGIGRTPTQKVGKHITVGIVFDSGGRGDKSFNDSAFAGTELAKKDVDIEVKPVDSHKEKDYELNLTTLAESKCDLIFAVGISQGKAVEAVAPKFPDVKFAIVDANVDKPNVRSLVFAEHEGSFLAGYVAGATTKSGKVGFVGGMEIPLIKKFYAGYAAGAKTANPKVELLPAKYTASWDDIDKGKAAADVLYNEGADIVYHAAGRCGLGVFNSAKEHSKYAIGVDSDQDGVKRGSVLTSMIKHVDQAVYQTIKDVATDKFTPGLKVYDLKSNGVGLSEMKFTKSIVGKDTLAKVAKLSDQIKKGTLVVPSSEEQLSAYLTKLSATPAPSPGKSK
jgi:basic membrane protein A and related proteins